jgi:1-acyl-sn-glycerol-3-phosphate acyltransferase
MAVDLIEERKSAELKGPNFGFLRSQAPLWNFLVDRWFRHEISGWERLPEPPALLIGVHACGILPIDAYAFAWQWFRHFGEERVMAGTAHDFLMVAPGIGDYLRALGAIPASRKGIFNALESGRDVLLYPGGDADAMRPWRRRDKVEFAGRHGFVKQAIRAQVPMVPVANSGGSSTYPMLTDGRRLARLFQLDKLLRSEVFPIGVGFPLGITPGVIPQIPLPAKLRTEILEPVDLGTDSSLEEDDEFVELKYREVCQKLQAGMDRLAKRRRFPVFG